MVPPAFAICSGGAGPSHQARVPPRDGHAARSLLHEGCLHPRVALGIERQRCPLGVCHQSHSTLSSDALPSGTDHAVRPCVRGGTQSAATMASQGGCSTRALLEKPTETRHRVGWPAPAGARLRLGEICRRAVTFPRSEAGGARPGGSLIGAKCAQCGQAVQPRVV